MPTFEITAPDGKRLRIEAPAGATQEQVLAYAQQNYRAQPQVTHTGGEARNPTEGMSGFDRFRAGLGKSLVDTAAGLKQLGTERIRDIASGDIFGVIGDRGARNAVTDWADRSLAAQRAEIDQRKQQDAALLDTGAGFAGNISGQIVQSMALPAARAATLPAKLAQAAATGGAFAASQPVATGDSRAINAAVGAGLGAGGQGVASGLGRLASSAANKLPQAVRDSIELARRAGIPLNVAQVTESPAIKAAAAASRYLPFSGAGKSARKTQEAFNAALGRSMGLDDAAYLTDDVMQGARKKIGGVFEDIYSRNDVELTPDSLRKLAAIESDAASRLTSDEAAVVARQFDKILKEAPDGVLTGKKYQAVRTALQKAEGPDKTGQAVKALRKSLDDIAAEAVSPDDAAALAKSRGQWANMRTIEDALKQVGGAAGNVRPAALWPLIRGGSTREMRELAKVGQNVLKEGIGDSGTAQRQFYTNLATGGSGLAGAASLGFLPLFAKAAAGGAVAGRALNSNIASKLLEQGKPTGALARLAQPAPRVLPVGTSRLVELLGLGGAAALTPEQRAELEIMLEQQGR